MDGSERREFTRVDVRIPVGIYLSDREHAEEGEIINISVGGACIRSASPVTTDQEVSIEFRFKGARLVSGKIVPLESLENSFESDQKDKNQVRWSTDDGKLHGLQFFNMSDDKRIFLERMVKYYSLLHDAGYKF